MNLVRKNLVVRSTASLLRRTARAGLALGGAALLAHCAEPAESAVPEAVDTVETPAQVEAALGVDASPLAACPTYSIGDHFYKYVSAGSTKSIFDIDAAIANEPACSYNGATYYPHLLAVNSSSENTLVADQLLKNKGVAGIATLQALSDSDKEGTFAWMTYGETSTYRANTLSSNSDSNDYVKITPQLDTSTNKLKFIWSLTSSAIKPAYYVIEFESAFPKVAYKDSDTDKFGGATVVGWAKSGAVLPAKVSTTTGDCSDFNSAINPGAAEVCDGVDNNCDGKIDETAPLYCLDTDKDTFGDPLACKTSCTNPGAGYVTNDGDCDDSDAAVHPGVTETCDGVDQDCDDEVDEGASCGSNCTQFVPNLDTTHAYLFCSATSSNQKYETIVAECTKRGYHPLVVNDVSEDRAVATEVAARFPGVTYSVVGLVDIDLNGAWSWVGDVTSYQPTSSGGTNYWFAWKPNTGDQVAWVTSQWNAGPPSQQLSFGSVANTNVFNTILCESW